MINRTKINNSIYEILDKDPKEITKYQEREAKKTPEQKEKEKEKRNKKSNITDVNLDENLNNQDSNPSNQVVVHTETDNLVHNYFHYFNLYWDAGDPLSSVIIKLPKTDTENTKYWITYTGEITIYLGNDINHIWKQEKNKNTVNNTEYWGLKGMLPIFRGEVGMIKEYQKVLEIHIDSIGKRFKQKIPDEFRQAFINNQNVRDAFQAICEFLGVKYICPPADAKPQDEETEDDKLKGDGTENSVDGKTNQEQQLASAASDVIQQAQNNQSTDANNGTSTDSNQNTNVQTALNESTEQSDIQNGYSDISFDAGGSIMHGSVAIETSPNMEDTLLALEEHPLDKYLEDTTFISTDVKKFLNGEMFETVHGPFLSYDSITVEPKSAPTSDMSTIGGVGGTTGTTGENGTSGSGEALNGWHNGQLYENGKIVLWNSYINTLSPQQASDKYNSGQDTYTEDTLQRLLWRANSGAILGG